jgi:tetratricopeptide (TPR) repeat protein
MGDRTNRIVGPVFGPVVQARNIRGGVHLHLPAPAPVALRGLPPSEGFTGRRGDLALLHEVLAPGTKSPNVAVICAVAGLAGVGKTALALEAGRRALDAGWFPGGVLFADLQGYDPARQVEPDVALGAFLRALGVPGEHIPPSQAEREALYRSVLAALADGGRRVLVVADNASTLEQVLPLRPGDAFHRMLVTSRHTLPVPAARRVGLDVLSESEAIDVLAQASLSVNPVAGRITAQRDEAARLARLCGCLPLALRIVANLLADRPERPISELAAVLEDSRDRLGELAYGQSIAVRTAFDTSYRRLPDLQARLFRLLALVPGPHAELGAAAALAQLPEEATRQVLDELRRAHLVQLSPDGAGYRLHDLLRLYAEESCRQSEEPADRAAAISRLLGYYHDTARDADSFVDLTARREERSASRFASHEEAVRWFESERPNLVAAAELAARERHGDHAQGITHALYRFFELRQHWTDWITTHQLAVAVARRDGRHRDEAIMLIRLGNAYHELDRLSEAAAQYERASALFVELADRRGEAQTLANMAVIHTRQESFDEALSCYGRALEIYQEIGDRKGEGETLANIGCAHTSKGEPARAVTYLLRASEVYQEIGYRKGDATIQLNLANAYVDLGRAEEGIASYRRAIEIHRNRGNRRWEGIARANLGITYSGLGRPAEALTCFREAMEIFDAINDLPNLEWTRTLIAIEDRGKGRRRWFRR